MTAEAKPRSALLIVSGWEEVSPLGARLYSEGDDLALADLRNCRRGAPYHLIGATLKLSARHDLDTGPRTSAPFLFSKLNCGSPRTGYRRTDRYMGGQLLLGTAVATSGAADGSVAGKQSDSRSLISLLNARLGSFMALLNMRLGYWAPTPNKMHWRSPQAQLWPFYMLRDFFAQTNDLSSYCYLTDGGHFDNTGLYSLVERGCLYIVLVDCGADPNLSFSDLGDAIRRCRIDFGAEIDIDLAPFLKKDGPRSHYVAGKIFYRREHLESLRWPPETLENGPVGVIVVVKPALVGDEPPDVRQYGLEDGDFPKSAGPAPFDDAQFESYRRLGQFCAQVLARDVETAWGLSYAPVGPPHAFASWYEKSASARARGRAGDAGDEEATGPLRRARQASDVAGDD